MRNEAKPVCDDDITCPLCQSPYIAPESMPMFTTEAVLYCVEHFRDKKQEYIICLSLDSGQRLIARRIVTIGLLEQSLVHPREVFAGPLKDHAASVIIVHNHPSGDPSPSQEDIKTTQQLVAASLILGIQLRDHIVVTRDKHFSFRASGLL